MTDVKVYSLASEGTQQVTPHFYVERIVIQKAPEAAAAHTMALLADGIREGVNGV